MASIRLQNVSKRYENGNIAVRNVDLDINDGEFMVLVGPSGCGKSTTLRMIAGLEDVTEGDAVIGDRRVNDVPPGQRDVAMVFQDYALYPHLTARDNLAFGLKTRRLAKSEIASRIEDAASLLSIQSLLDRCPHEMSGGERQRIALGRAIVRKPKAFLFDEPLSNLDAQLRLEMRTQLANMHRRLQTTTLYVTHDQGEAMTLGDRIAVMKDGRIQQVATPLELYHQPANRFVAEFVGSPAMNFIEGSVEGGCFVAEGIRYEIGGKAAAMVSGVCALGFRPEGVTLQQPAGGAASHAKLADVRVEIVERLGHETLVYFQLGGRVLAMRLGPDVMIQCGDDISIYLPDDRWYLFSSAEEGAACIASGRAGYL